MVLKYAHREGDRKWVEEIKGVTLECVHVYEHVQETAKTVERETEDREMVCKAAEGVLQRGGRARQHSWTKPSPLSLAC